MATKKKAPKPAFDDQKLKQWVQDGVSLVKAKNGNQWEIGDWIRNGVETFGTKEAYNRAMQATGMTRATLQQFKYTAECFPISTRVKNLFFGHHRLVAKKKRKSKDGIESGFTRGERKRLLLTAITRKFSVAKFDAYLKNREKKVERQEDTPRNADEQAKKVVERCQYLRGHLSIRALYKSQPPTDGDLRKKVLSELRATAEELKKNAEWLEANWEQFYVVNYKKFAAAAGRQ